MKKKKISEIGFAGQPWFQYALEQSVKENVIKNSGAYLTAAISTDLNELRTYGEYIVSGSAPNAPVPIPGVLNVRGYGVNVLGERVVQTYYTSDGRVFSRFKYISNSFTAWREL